MCGPASMAKHTFTRCFENSQRIVLHFEHFRCDGRGAFARRLENKSATIKLRRSRLITGCSDYPTSRFDQP
jgi:hypothetical protein